MASSHAIDSRVAKRFERVYIEISNICNLKCTFCPEVERMAQKMSLDEFRVVLREVTPWTSEVCLHVMGEPLAHPQFAEFVKECGAVGLKVQITTNGTLLRPASIEALLLPQVRQVNFSVQSFFANHSSGEKLETYLAPIFDFVARAEAARPDLYLQFRLWDEGAIESAQNIRLLGRLEERFGVKVNRSGVDLRFRKLRPLGGRKSVHFDSRFRWPNLADPALGSMGTCLATTQHVAVHVDGKVVPCCLDKEAAIELGNIFEKDLGAIMAGPRARRMSEGFARGTFCEELCQRCDFARRFAKRAEKLQEVYA